MDRVFLDANVLFSAAYSPDSGLLRIWQLEGAMLITSEYAVLEAHRNLAEESQRLRLEGLLESVEITRGEAAVLPPEVGLPEKDRPILAAAVASRCSHLVTGDVRHFGHLFDTTVAGV